VELAKVNDALKSEKQTRDKLQHERDALAAEKYSTDQQLKVLAV